jgi:hypothetical protein
VLGTLANIFGLGQSKPTSLGKAADDDSKSASAEGAAGGRAARDYVNAGHATCDELQRKLEENRRGLGHRDAPMALQPSVLAAALEPGPADADTPMASEVDQSMADTDASVVADTIAAAAQLESSSEVAADSAAAETVETEAAAPATTEASTGASSAVPSAKFSALKDRLKTFEEDKSGAARAGPQRVPAPAVAKLGIAGSAVAGSANDLKRKAEPGAAGAGASDKELQRQAVKQRQAEAERAAKEQKEREQREKEKAVADRIEALKKKKEEEAKQKKLEAQQRQQEQREKEEKSKREAIKAAEEAREAEKRKTDEAREAARRKAEEERKRQQQQPQPQPQQQQQPAIAALPEGWTAHTDAKSGREYYHHAKDKVTTWTRPGGLSASIASASTADMIPADKPASSEEDDDEEEARPAHELPKWTWKQNFEAQLQAQQGMDGDAIFGTQLHELETAIELEDVFEQRGGKKRYHKRGSSANWTADRLTTPEVDEHKRKMGFFGR